MRNTTSVGIAIAIIVGSFLFALPTAIEESLLIGAIICLVGSCIGLQVYYNDKKKVVVEEKIATGVS